MDSVSYLQFIFALLVVVALIGALAYGAKRLGLIARVTINGPKRKKRLNIVEILPVDAKRRLVLIRRDGREHLLLLGTERDIVVERGIEVPETDLVKAGMKDSKV